MKKLIGISSRTMMVDGVNKLFVNQRYLNYLNLYGFKCIILPLKLDDEILDLCDGFLITGGNDSNPLYYNQQLHPTSELVEPEVDEADLKIIKYAVKHNKPLLGICRGLQVINIAFKGSLHQDIPNHRKVNHPIYIDSSRLIPTLDKVEEANSYHHQAIDSLGVGLAVVARANDNIIEIIEHTSLPIIAVQFHPEIVPNSMLSSKIMNAFSSLFQTGSRLHK